MWAGERIIIKRSAVKKEEKKNFVALSLKGIYLANISVHSHNLFLFSFFLQNVYTCGFFLLIFGSVSVFLYRFLIWVSRVSTSRLFFLVQQSRSGKNFTLQLMTGGGATYLRYQAGILLRHVVWGGI